MKNQQGRAISYEKGTQQKKEFWGDKGRHTDHTSLVINSF